MAASNLEENFLPGSSQSQSEVQTIKTEKDSEASSAGNGKKKSAAVKRKADGTATKSESKKAQEHLKIDCALSVQKTIRRLRIWTCTEPVDELGQHEAKLLQIESFGSLSPESMHTEIDSTTFNEADKNGAIVRTLDNFSVYDRNGQPFELSRLFLDPSSAEGLQAFGTVLAPLEINGVSLLRVARAVPRDPYRRLIVELLEKKAAGKHRSGVAAGKSSGDGAKASNPKTVEHNPDLTREEAWSQANSSYLSTQLPLVLGGVTILSLGKIVEGDSAYHTRTHLFPPGFKSERTYASVVDPSSRGIYVNQIVEGDGGPIFRVIHDGGAPLWEGRSASSVWQNVLNDLNRRREDLGLARGGETISGPEMFGLSHAKVSLILEGLPGVLGCKAYVFRAKRVATRDQSSSKRRSEPAKLASPAKKRSRDEHITSAVAKRNSIDSKTISTLESCTSILNDLSEKEKVGLIDALDALKTLELDHSTLSLTGVGRLVYRLRKHVDKSIAMLARNIREEWKMKIREDFVAVRNDFEPVIECMANVGSFIGLHDDELCDSLKQKLLKSNSVNQSSLDGTVIDHNERSLKNSNVHLIKTTLQRLLEIPLVNRNALRTVGIGKLVSRLMKHLDGGVQNLACQLKSRWEAQIAKEDDDLQSQDTDKDTSMNIEANSAAVSPNPTHCQVLNSNGHSEYKHPKTENGEGRPKLLAKGSSVSGEDEGVIRRSVRKSESDRRKMEDDAAYRLKLEEESADFCLQRTRLEERIPYFHALSDKLFPLLKSVKAERLASKLALRPRIRVAISGISGINFTHGEHDGILWLETESVRYRIAGRNVVSAPAINYYRNFVGIWKHFEACRRFITMIEGDEKEALGLDQVLKAIVDEDLTPCPCRVYPPSIPSEDLGVENRKLKTVSNDVLTRKDVLNSTLFILEQLTRAHKSIEKVLKMVEHKAVTSLISRGTKVMIEEHRDYVRRCMVEDQRNAKVGARELQRREIAIRRSIEDGAGLPDDMEIVKEDEARSSLDDIQTEFLRSLAEKQMKAKRPVPLFLPVDSQFVGMKQLCFSKFSRIKKGDFRSHSLGAFGVLQANERFSQEGQLFSEFLSLYSGLQFLSPLLYDLDDHPQPCALKSFAKFRNLFAKSRLDDILIDLVAFLAKESQGQVPEGSTNASSTSKGSGLILGVAEEGGIATRRTRRSGRFYNVTYAVPEAASVSSYAYNADELWPIPMECIDRHSWPEVLRRALVHHLQTLEASVAHEEDIDEGENSGNGKRNLRQYASKPQQAIFKRLTLIEPDLMSTCDEIITSVMNDHAAASFCQPVDPVAQNVPTYLDIISRPMDLQTIQDRIRNGHYDTHNLPDNHRYYEIIQLVNPNDGSQEDGAAPEEDDDDSTDPKNAEELKKCDNPYVGCTEKALHEGSANDEKAVKSDITSSVEGVPEIDYPLQRSQDTRDKANEALQMTEKQNGRKGDYSDASVEDGKTERKPIIVNNHEDYLYECDKRFYDSDARGGGHFGVAADVRQVWRNCKKFNLPNTKLYHECKRILGLFEKEYHEKVLLRDVSLVEETSSEAVESLVVSEPKSVDTTEELGPYHASNMPSLETAMLNLTEAADFSALSLHSKLRIASTLLDMVLETSAVVSFIRERMENAQSLQKELIKSEREDAKKERELANNAEKLALHRSDAASRRANLEAELKKNQLRLEPLGCDRFFNRYWLLDDGASPWVHVELARTGQWGLFNGIKETDDLLSSLDTRGCRENALSRSLSTAWPKRKSKIEELIASVDPVARKYLSIISADGTRELEKEARDRFDAVQERLREAEAELARASRLADEYGEARTPENRIYYYHRGSRETNWKMPEEVRQKKVWEKTVSELNAQLVAILQEPTEELRRLEADLKDDFSIQFLNRINSSKKAIDPTVLLKEESRTLKVCCSEGFRYRIFDFLARLTSFESFTVSDNARFVRAPKRHEWMSSSNGANGKNTRDDWVKDLGNVEDSLRRYNESNQEIWTNEILPGLRDSMKRLYSVFTGSPYDVEDEAGQIAVIGTVSHEFRWLRAVDRAHSLPELGLLLVQFSRILSLDDREERNIDDLRKKIMETKYSEFI